MDVSQNYLSQVRISLRLYPTCSQADAKIVCLNSIVFVMNVIKQFDYQFHHSNFKPII